MLSRGSALKGIYSRVIVSFCGSLKRGYIRFVTAIDEMLVKYLDGLIYSNMVAPQACLNSSIGPLWHWTDFCKVKLLLAKGDRLPTVYLNG